MTRPVRLMTGLVIQGVILFLVIGGLVYNVFGIQDWLAHGVANSVINPVEEHSTPTPTPAHHHRHHGDHR